MSSRRSACLRGTKGEQAHAGCSAWHPAASPDTQRCDCPELKHVGGWSIWCALGGESDARGRATALPARPPALPAACGLGPAHGWGPLVRFLHWLFHLSGQAGRPPTCWGTSLGRAPACPAPRRRPPRPPGAWRTSCWGRRRRGCRGTGCGGGVVVVVVGGEGGGRGRGRGRAVVCVCVCVGRGGPGAGPSGCRGWEQRVDREAMGLQCTRPCKCRHGRAGSCSSGLLGLRRRPPGGSHLCWKRLTLTPATSVSSWCSAANSRSTRRVTDSGGWPAGWEVTGAGVGWAGAAAKHLHTALVDCASCRASWA